VSGDSAAAQTAVRQMQAALLARNPALVARLYRKVGDDRCTLMETYAMRGPGIDPVMQRRIEEAAALALSRWCSDGRHVEVFEACG
jgi:hypothetical protein